MVVKDQIRYSEAFKLQVIGELESGALGSQEEARRKYGIGGRTTIHKWLRRYGRNHLLSKVIRVEKPEERDQIKVLKRRIRELEKALADSKVKELLSEAHFEILCERHGEKDIAGVKKKIAEQLWREQLDAEAEGRE